MKQAIWQIGLAGALMLAACDGSGTVKEKIPPAPVLDGGDFGAGDIAKLCPAYENDFVDAEDQMGLDTTEARRVAALAIAQCCPKMAEASADLTREQREFLWTDMASGMGMTLPPGEVGGYMARFDEMKGQMPEADRAAALAPKDEVYKSCRADLY